MEFVKDDADWGNLKIRRVSQQDDGFRMVPYG